MHFLVKKHVKPMEISLGQQVSMPFWPFQRVFLRAEMTTTTSTTRIVQQPITVQQPQVVQPQVQQPVASWRRPFSSLFSTFFPRNREISVIF